MVQRSLSALTTKMEVSSTELGPSVVYCGSGDAKEAEVQNVQSSKSSSAHSGFCCDFSAGLSEEDETRELMETQSE